MSTHSEIVTLRTLAKRLPKLNYLRNDRQNLKQLDPENEAKARLKRLFGFSCRIRKRRIEHLGLVRRRPLSGLAGATAARQVRLVKTEFALNGIVPRVLRLFREAFQRHVGLSGGTVPPVFVTLGHRFDQFRSQRRILL